MSEQFLTIPLQETINAQFREFAKQTKEYIDAIRKEYVIGDTPAMGELEFDIPIKSVEQAVNVLSTHCTKYQNDYIDRMITPLIVDEWQAVEEVRYVNLLRYQFTEFASDERKINVYALTLCHNLKKVVFDSLLSISLPEADLKFIASNIRLEEVSMPALTSISVRGNTQVLTELSALTSLSLPSLTSINNSSGGTTSSQILSGLSSLTSLSMPAITSINSSGIPNSSQILSGCANLQYIEIGYTSIDGGSITGNMRLNINPTNIYEDATKLAALNASIREHWFANLRDYTGGTAHTLTLMSAFVAHLEAETIQVATDKNWTIVTF